MIKEKANYWAYPILKRKPVINRRLPKELKPSVKKLICEFYDVTIADALSRNRKRPIVTCRHVIKYFLKKYFDLSLTEIGREFGQDHTSVLSSIRVVNDLCETEEEFRNDIETLKYRINNL